MVAGAGLAIRSDATAGIGIGHVMRCIGLAEAWPGESGRLFIGCVENGALANRIRESGFRFNPLKKIHPDPDDLKETRRQLTVHRESLGRTRKQVVILDGYHFDTRYHQAIQDPGRTTLIVDDMIHLPRYDADLILNQNCLPEKKYYQCNAKTVILSGSKFRLIRSEFRRHGLAARRRSGAGIRLLVFMGGADKRNVTLAVIRALGHFDHQPFHAKVLLGPINRHRKQLLDAVSATSKRIELLESVDDPAALFGWADLGIAAGGGSCWEMAFMGLSLVLTALNENQAANVNELCHAGAAVDAGPFDDFSEDVFLSRLGALCADSDRRADMARRARTLVDGNGSNRVARIVEAMNTGALDLGSAVVRPARKEDAQSLYQMAMDPEVRQNSFSPDPIPYEHHCRWLHEKLSPTGDTAIWILDFEGLTVGQIRYDRRSSDHADIDFSIHPAFRSMGLGSYILKQTREMALAKLGVSRLSGVVFASNRASGACFAKSGYTASARKTIQGRFCEIFDFRPE